MWIGVISLFPEMFRAITEHGVTGRAVKSGLLQIECWNPRDFTHDKHRTVDDRPYGGGPGMLMMVQPLRDAIHAAKQAAGDGAKVIYLSPQGRKLTQAGVTELATNQTLILVAGRYEGIDERVIQTEVDEEWSIGDYVLSGGQCRAGLLHGWPAGSSPLHSAGVVGWIGGARGADKRQSRSDSALASQAVARTNLAEKAGTY